jgi:hypothetical protein
MNEGGEVGLVVVRPFDVISTGAGRQARSVLSDQSIDGTPQIFADEFGYVCGVLLRGLGVTSAVSVLIDRPENSPDDDQKENETHLSRPPKPPAPQPL